MAFPILAVLPIIGEIISKIIPDPKAAAEAKVKMFELAQNGELAYLDADVRLATAQIDVNKADAQSSSGFRGNWRPAAGWTCVIVGLGYPPLRALLPWALQVAGMQGVPPLPPLDSGEAMTLLFGLLGFGGFRTVERLKGKA